ncbi:MAG TPA: hypothetical protein VEJ18_10370 [Planctomycetota bacterium]|nr:hypothetical protein [Planctomycetota bacterium]
MLSLSRREAMARFGLFGAAAALLPGRLWAERVSQDAVVLGDGAHKYEWIKNWAKVPEGKTFAPTHGCVQVDSKDNVYVNTDNKDAVLVFDKDGNFLRSWGGDMAGGSAHGMCIVKEGDKEFCYVAHTGRHKVFKATLEGEVVLTLPWPQMAGVYEKEGDYAPTMVAVAPDGGIYIAAGYGKPNRYIHHYDKAGQYVRSFDGAGTDGALNNVHGVWIDGRGGEPLVLAVSRGNGKLIHFTLDGKYKAVIAEKLPAPCKAYIRGEDILVPNLRGGCTILGKDNQVIAYIGENKDPKRRGNFNVEPKDWVDGEFTAPHGACWDSQGNLYCEDWNKFGRLNKLKRLG